jgi:two-component system chemotaxis sensor kinase CheA
MVEQWKFEPLRTRLFRVAEQVRAVALKLRKGDLMIDVEPNGLRLPAERWAPFWSAFGHLVRNAVDHGLETPEDRVRLGKPESGRLALRTKLVDEKVIVEIEDDGTGIDWTAVAAKAKARGLPHGTPEDLHSALFVDGFSTKDAANEYSGRGVGLGAMRAACQAMGGTIQFHSEAGVGTCVRVAIPLEIVTIAKEPSPRAKPRLSVASS